MKGNLIYEKFKQESDPVHDLGIGIRELWKEQRKKIWNTTFGELHKKYFSKYVNSFDTALCDALCEIINDLTRGFSPQRAFDSACIKNGFGKDNSGGEYYRKILAKVVNKEFHINVKPDTKVNERFEQDSDPIKDMGIGLYEKYKDKLKSYEIDQVLDAMRSSSYNNAVTHIDEAFGTKNMKDVYCPSRSPIYHNNFKPRERDLIEKGKLISDQSWPYHDGGCTSKDAKLILKVYESEEGKIGILKFCADGNENDGSNAIHILFDLVAILTYLNYYDKKT